MRGRAHGSSGALSGEVEVQLVAPVYRNRATLEELAARVHASLDDAGLPSHELLLFFELALLAAQFRDAMEFTFTSRMGIKISLGFSIGLECVSM